MPKAVKLSLKGKKLQEMGNGQSGHINDFEKEIDPGAILTLPWNNIHASDHYS